MNRSISASSRWTSREMSSSSMGSRSSGESPEEFPALLPPPWRRSSRDNASPVDTAEPVWRKSMDDIWEFSPNSSCSLGCLHPSPAAAVSPTASTTTQTEQNPSKVSAKFDELQQTEERVRGESLRGACAGCSGKADGGLKKASGAGICPSTGTGSAFLPKIAASRKEFQRDSYHTDDLKR
jgi:hypothetical protein